MMIHLALGAVEAAESDLGDKVAAVRALLTRVVLVQTDDNVTERAGLIPEKKIKGAYVLVFLTHGDP